MKGLLIKDYKLLMLQEKDLSADVTYCDLYEFCNAG